MKNDNNACPSEVIRDRLKAAFPADFAVMDRETLRMVGRVSFGYIGNCGTDRSGFYDDRSWRVFVARTDGRPLDSVGSYTTARLADMLADLDAVIIPAVDRLLDGGRR